MDRDRLKEVHQTDLTESRVNEDFVDWLKNKGPSWLLFGLLGICAYLAVVRFKQHRVDTVNTAWADLFQADLPSSFEDVARDHGNVGQIANLAWVRAADQLLDAVQAGTTLDAPRPQRGAQTPPPALQPEHYLTPEQRKEYLDRADALYGQVIGKGVKNDDSGAVLYLVNAMNGKAAVAESRGDSAKASEWYGKAAEHAAKFYPGLAEQARTRAASTGGFTQEKSFRTQSELRTAAGNTAPTTPIRIDGAARADPAGRRVTGDAEDRVDPEVGSDVVSDVRSAEDVNDRVITPGGKVDQQALFELYAGADDEEDRPATVRFVLSRDLNKRLDRYLVDRIPFLSRTNLQRLIREEAVTVNGRAPKASTKLRRGDVVIAVLPPPPSKAIPAEDIPLAILYEDEDLIVLNKHDDIIVHPARGNRSGTIINGLAFHFMHRSGGALSTVGEEFARPGVVHRLDRHTTGVMVAAKSDTAHWRLGRQFEKRTTEKRYLALVHGRMEPYADVIDVPLGKHPTVKTKYAVRWDPTGKEAVTIYRVREVYEDYTLVELELKTGRTHQIRVHLAHLGYPIVGDDIYGGRHLVVGDVTGPAAGPGRSPRDPLITRQALHATLLAFRHPTTEKRVEFTAPLPPDMAGLIALLRAHRKVERPTVAGATVDLDVAIGA